MLYISEVIFHCSCHRSSFQTSNCPGGCEVQRTRVWEVESSLRLIQDSGLELFCTQTSKPGSMIDSRDKVQGWVTVNLQNSIKYILFVPDN